jgi:hypothetical protein
MEAARARELPMSLERNLVMLHSMKPHYDPVKEGSMATGSMAQEAQTQLPISAVA